jgi:excisionase family DNA binding protein
MKRRLARFGLCGRSVLQCAPVTLLLLGVFLGVPATADARSESPVLTLEEAAELLRLTPDELEEAIARGEVPGRRIGGEWRLARAALLDWLAGAEPPPPLTQDDLAGITETDSDATSAADADEPIDAGTGDGADDPADAPTRAAEDATPIGEAPKLPTAEEVFLRSESVLLAPGEFTIEPGFFYFERQEDVLVFSEGMAIGLAELDEQAFTFDLRTRVGIFDETEFLAGIAFSKAESEVEFGGTTIDDFSRSEFGDLRLGVRRTLLHEGVGYPDVVLTVGGRIPVEEGSYGVGTGLALVKSIDPAVLFANVEYRHTFSRDFDDVTRLQPEDRVDFGLGFAYSLNDSITLSTQVGGVITGETDFDDATLPQRELFFLELGLTARLARSLYVEPTVSFGLNGDDNRVVLGVTAPFTFGR